MNRGGSGVGKRLVDFELCLEPHTSGHINTSFVKLGQLYFLKNPHLRTCLLILEREEGKERERERNIDVREKHQSIASCIHPD